MKKLIIIFTSLLLFFSFSVQPKAKLKDNPTKNYGVMISQGLNFEYATYYSKPNEKPMGKLKHATALKKGTETEYIINGLTVLKVAN